MASTEIQSIRDRLDRMMRDRENVGYHVNAIREHISTLDEYVASLEDTVNMLSQRVIILRDK